jgi:hypothetical protein
VIAGRLYVYGDGEDDEERRWGVDGADGRAAAQPAARVRGGEGEGVRVRGE